VSECKSPGHECAQPGYKTMTPVLIVGICKLVHCECEACKDKAEPTPSYREFCEKMGREP